MADRLRRALEEVLGREIALTEDIDKTAEDLESYIRVRDAETPVPEEAANPTDCPKPQIEVDLIDSGLLWLFNTTALHPHGLALAVDTETGQLFLGSFGDGEAIVFLDEDAQRGHIKFRDTIHRFQAEVVESRVET